MRQFFAESATLTTTSGLVGFIIGAGFCAMIRALPVPDFFPKPDISVAAVLVSILTLSLVTIASGMYPARRAAELTPVESLRYE